AEAAEIELSVPLRRQAEIEVDLGVDVSDHVAILGEASAGGDEAGRGDGGARNTERDQPRAIRGPDRGGWSGNGERGDQRNRRGTCDSETAHGALLSSCPIPRPCTLGAGSKVKTRGTTGGASRAGAPS